MNAADRLKALRERLEHSDDRRLYPALARLLWKSGRHEEALDVIGRGREAFPHYLPVLMASAEIHKLAGDSEAARAGYEHVAELDPRNLPALESLAALYLEDDRADLAEPVFRRMLEIDPENDAAAEALRDMGAEHKTDKAPSQPADDSFPGLRPTRTMAELYAGQGAPDKAAAVYRKLLEKDPGNDDWKRRLRELEEMISK